MCEHSSQFKDFKYFCFNCGNTLEKTKEVKECSSELGFKIFVPIYKCSYCNIKFVVDEENIFSI